MAAQSCLLTTGKAWQYGAVFSTLTTTKWENAVSHHYSKQKSPSNDPLIKARNYRISEIGVQKEIKRSLQKERGIINGMEPYQDMGAAMIVLQIKVNKDWLSVA